MFQNSDFKSIIRTRQKVSLPSYIRFYWKLKNCIDILIYCLYLLALIELKETWQNQHLIPCFACSWNLKQYRSSMGSDKISSWWKVSKTGDLWVNPLSPESNCAIVSYPNHVYGISTIHLLGETIQLMFLNFLLGLIFKLFLIYKYRSAITNCKSKY